MESDGNNFGEQHPHYQHVCCCKGAMNVVQDIKDGFESFVQEKIDVLRKEILALHQAVLVSTTPGKSRSLIQQVESPASRFLRLHFDNSSLPDALCTMDKIEDQEASLKVELLDASGSRVEDGPESSTKIRIVVLDGETELEDNEWTEEDFSKHLVRPRKDKPPVLKGGKYEIFMEKGVASISDISFTDNSTRSGTFRLGAQAVKAVPGVVIREAVSKAFKVKERRMKFDGKRKKPSPGDALWCLNKIGKQGPVYQRAVKANIHTVQDFLQLYHTDAKKMHSILDVHETNWKEIVKNAEACDLSDELKSYYDDTNGIELLLDCAFNIRRVTFKGYQSQLYESLNASEKKLVDEVRCLAYERRTELNTYTSTHQTSIQVESAGPSITRPASMLYPNATVQGQGEVLMQNSSSFVQGFPKELGYNSADAAFEKHNNEFHSYASTNQINSHAEHTYSSSTISTMHPYVHNLAANQGVLQYQTGETLPSFLDDTQSLDMNDFFAFLDDELLQPSTSSSQVLICDANKRKPQSPRGRWLPIRAALMFKTVYKVSIKQGAKTLKRRRLD